MFGITLRGWPLWALLAVLGCCAVASTVYAIWPQRYETVAELRAQAVAPAAIPTVRTAAPTRTATANAITVSSSGVRVPQYPMRPNDWLTAPTKSGTPRKVKGPGRAGTLLMLR